MRIMYTKACAALNLRCWLTDRVGVDTLMGISGAYPDKVDARYVPAGVPAGAVGVARWAGLLA